MTFDKNKLLIHTINSHKMFIVTIHKTKSQTDKKCIILVKNKKNKQPQTSLLDLFIYLFIYVYNASLIRLIKAHHHNHHQMKNSIKTV